MFSGSLLFPSLVPIATRTVGTRLRCNTVSNVQKIPPSAFNGEGEGLDVMMGLEDPWSFPQPIAAVLSAHRTRRRRQKRIDVAFFSPQGSSDDQTRAVLLTTLVYCMSVGICLISFGRIAEGSSGPKVHRSAPNIRTSTVLL